MNTNGYPFLTRRQILERLEDEPDFCLECIKVLEARTASRQGHAAQVNRFGWMSTDISRAGTLTKRLASRPNPKDVQAALQLVRRYARQLAEHFRAEALATNPELAATAARFSALPRVTLTPAFPPTHEPDAPDALPLAESTQASAVSSADTDAPSLETRLVESLSVMGPLRIEELAALVETSTADLAPALHSLVEAGRLEKSGKARGTRYALV